MLFLNYSKKHKDKKVHITFDHMFSHDNYVTLMFTMRVGKQGIPIWFKSFKQEYINKEVSLEKGGAIAFNESLIIEGIKHISALFNESFDLIFLADRWFNSEKILSTIYKTNIVISKYLNTKDPWIIVTNKDVEHAIQNYSHRFGSIECVFKNQKSNGLYLEAINNASEKAYNTMYTMACTVVLFLTIIGADYSKNTKCYKNEKIVTHKVYKDKGKVRVMSLFKIGLTLFYRAVNSTKYIRLPIRFILYDI